MVGMNILIPFKNLIAFATLHYIKKNGGWIICLPTTFRFPNQIVQIHLLRAYP